MYFGLTDFLIPRLPDFPLTDSRFLNTFARMNKISKPLLLTILLLVIVQVAFSQCAMCTEIADEATKNGNSAGDGINKGVLYLFLSPYLIVATIGFIWWRSRRKAQQDLQIEA